MGTTGALTKDNPARIKRDLSIANDEAAGKTYAQLSKIYGLTKGRISQILNDKNIKPIREQTRRDIIALAPYVPHNYHKLLQSENEKIRLEATRDIAKIMDIDGTRTDNIFNHYVSNININTKIGGLLFNKIYSNHEARDAEFEDILDDD